MTLPTIPPTNLPITHASEPQSKTLLHAHMQKCMAARKTPQGNLHPGAALGLMTHMVVGFPSLDANRQMLAMMAKHSIDLVELQFPFSEPIADGPLFCRANQASLAAGTSLDDCFALLQEAHAEYGLATLMMGYANTAFCLGPDVFAQRLAQASALGCILPDLPVELATPLASELKAHRLAMIHLLTPTTTEDRLAKLARHTAEEGLAYAVARRGVTGTPTQIDDTLNAFLQRCLNARPGPVAVGFGIRTPEQIHSLRGRAHVAVVGSAFLQIWLEEGPQAADRFLAALSQAANPTLCPQ